MSVISTVVTEKTLNETFGASKHELPMSPVLIDLENVMKREFYLQAVIEEKDGEDLASLIRRCNQQDVDRGIPVSERQPIKIYIDSYGGVLSSAMSIVDAVDLSETPVYTIVTGVAYSAAGIILMCGHKRYAYKSATFLLHDGSLQVMGDMSKVKDHIKFDERYEEEVIIPFVMGKTVIDKKTYEENVRRDWFMTTTDMLKYKVVDEILTRENNFM